MLSDPKREAEIEFEIKVAKEPWRRVLRDAAELLKTHGWCKMFMRNYKGAHCALGALSAVSRDGMDHANACIMLRNHLIKTQQGTAIVVWNDTNDAQTVISTLESVARE